MRYSLLLVAVLAAASFAVHGDFDWQSLGGQPGEELSITLIESDASHMVLDITVPGFWLGRTVAGGTAWDSIELPGVHTQTEIGLPEVPNIGQMFALPFGSDAVVTIGNVEYTTYTGINLVPVQTPEIDMPHNPYPFTQNEAVYGTNSFFPSNWAAAVSPGTWGGISIDKLLANPFRYNPVTEELQVARSMRVSIDFAGTVDAVAYPSTETIRNSASRMLINYDMVDAAASVTTDAEAAEYIFVTTDANLSAILPLVEFYQGIGYETSVESFSGSAGVNEIQAAIFDHYDTGITRFALIAGDFDALPSYNYGNFVGDYWYGCVTGSDLFPELAVGRLTGNASQIETQVAKIIDGYYRYDFAEANTPGIIPSTGVLAAHQEDYPDKYTACCNEIAAASYAVNMSFLKIYPPEGGTSAMVEESFNNGVGSVGYRGHAFVLYWSWNPGWSKTNIQALTNTFMPPVWSIACYSGQYQTSAESLAESFVWDDNGASGNLGATYLSFTETNHSYMKQIYLNLYGYGNYNVGEALNESAAWIITNHGSAGEDNARMYIWFGDPAMEIFTNDTANPVPLQIDCPEMVNPGSQTIPIIVTSDGSPVSGATVALSDGIDGVETITFFETATTDGSGQASFNVNVPSGASTLYTGARLHNYNPVAEKISVYPMSVENGEENTVLGISISSNPVADSALLNFSTPVAGHTTLRVFDLSGRTVDTLVTEEVVAGNHSVTWTTERVSSGIYFIRLATPSGFSSTQVIVFH